MICEKCGAEIKDGNLYCSVCGYEVHFISEYKILEDDLIDSYIGDQKPAEKEEQKKKNIIKQVSLGSRKKKLIFSFVSIGILALLIFLIFTINQKLREAEYNSYDFQYESGTAAFGNQEYETAQSYLERALELAPEDYDTLLALAKTYLALDKYSAAESILLGLVEAYPGTYEIYETLLDLYVETEDYKSITMLYSYKTDEHDEAINALFEDYILDPPTFSKVTGKYKSDLSIAITASSEDYTIYYTIDGSNPTEDGLLYKKEITLSGEGVYELKAVCVDSRGIYSEIMECTYEIVYPVVKRPSASLTSGTYTGEQWIVVNVPENTVVYYTWDGTTPTTASPQYTEPLSMPEGESTLTLIAYQEGNGYSKTVTYTYTMSYSE